MKFFILLLFTLGILSLNAQDQKTTPIAQADTTNWVSLKVDQYELTIPADWEVDTTGKHGTKLILFSPIEGLSDPFRENVNLLEEAFPLHDLSHEQYISLSLANMKNMMQNFELISSEKKQAKGLDYQHVVYRTTNEAYDLRYEQYFWVFDHNAVVITFTAQQNKSVEKLKVGQQILNSLLFLNPPSQDIKSAPLASSTEWRTFQQDEYKLEYPARWALDTSGQYGTKLMLFSPLADLADGFKENVNLMTEVLPSKRFTLDQYVTAAIGQIKNIIDDYELLSNEKKNEHGRDYQHLIYNGAQGGMKLRFQQYCWVAEQTAYILTFTTERDKVDDYQETGMRILKSFKLN